MGSTELLLQKVLPKALHHKEAVIDKPAEFLIDFSLFEIFVSRYYLNLAWNGFGYLAPFLRGIEK